MIGKDRTEKKRTGQGRIGYDKIVGYSTVRSKRGQNVEELNLNQQGYKTKNSPAQNN